MKKKTMAKHEKNEQKVSCIKCIGKEYKTIKDKMTTICGKEYLKPALLLIGLVT